MWLCPNCGEQIDDVFDACWKCDTAQDGALAADFQAEPSDSETLDPRAQSAPADETAKDSDAALNDLKNERIVELCSAANVVEAYALRALLEEADIRSRIVGESLGNAAGWLPLGETVAPRVWVREEDAARAREIIDERIGQPCQELSSLAEDEEGGVPRASDVRFRWLSQGLLLIGLACILFGSVWAWYAWMTMHKYAGTTEGVVVDYQWHYSVDSNPTSEIPIPRVPPTLSVWYEVQYAFVVNGKTYYSVDPHCEQVVDRMPIHYDPHDPATNVVGSLTSSWLVLAFALAIGGSLSFVGCYLARTGRQPNSRQ